MGMALFQARRLAPLPLRIARRKALVWLVAQEQGLATASQLSLGKGITDWLPLASDAVYPLAALPQPLLLASERGC